MKQILTVLAMVVFTGNTMAQEAKAPFKIITVNGSAEAEVIPDEIYVQVELREYTRKNGDKTDITVISNQFLAACKALGLSEKDVSVAGFQGYDHNYWWNRKNKKQNPDMKAGITYWVKLNSTQQLDALVEKMDDEATQNFFIAKTAYSKIEALKRELKIAAIKAARDKANYLAEAIGEKAGPAVTVNEPVEALHYPQPVYANTMLKAVSAEDMGTPAMSVDFRKIKLQYDVNVVFSLQ